MTAVLERRTAEIRDARLGDTAGANELWQRRVAADPGDVVAARALERLALAAGKTALRAHVESMARTGPAETRSAAQRRAAAVAEASGEDLDAAIEARRAAVAGDDLAGLTDLARLFRKAHRPEELAETYKQMASLTGATRTAAALRCAAGAVELSCHRYAEAEAAFREAAAAAPEDPTARVGLAWIHRAADRFTELCPALEEIATLARHETTRLQALLELARVTALELDDPRAAIRHLEAARELDPGDAGRLFALGVLYTKVASWSKAIDLLHATVDALTDDAPTESALGGPVPHRVDLLMEIGSLEERQRRDDDAALVAYQAALAIDESFVDAVAAIADIHRRHDRKNELADVLRRQLPLTEHVDGRVALQLEIARCVEATAAGVDAPLLEYRAVLDLDPGHAAALASVDQIARAAGRWEDIADAFRAAPPTAERLAVLAEALERLALWEELIKTHRARIPYCGDNRARARLAATAAALEEQKRGASDAAIDLYEECLRYDPTPADAQAALARLLEASERWPELAAALERELSTATADDTERQKALLLRLGELRRDKLGKAGDAALAYEAVLEIEPTHVPSLVALEPLYEQLGREKDLLRVLEARASTEEDRTARAGIFLRVADLRARRNDSSGAAAAYAEAFAADPTNRDTFTAMEKLCYKHERWHDAMRLYDQAIELVEKGGSRAYRLGDLYARRGQIQLQYLDQPGEAASSYLRVVELDPDNDSAVKYLEAIFSQQGDWTGLIGAYETRAQLARDDERRLETLRRAARVAGAKLKDPGEAARLYRAILDIDGSDQEAIEALERFYERAQDWGNLVEVIKIRQRSAPAGDAAVALLKRVAQICEDGLRDEARAVENYLRILEIAPGNKEALEALGRIYESTEQWSEFIDVTRRQIRVTTDRNMKALLYFKCGSVMEAKFSKEEDAIRYYDAAIKTSPSCLPAVHGLRDLYRRRHDWPRVIQTLELEVKLWQDDKERAGVFAQIGQIYANQLGQPDRALHYFESALAVDPECLPANRALFEQYFAAQDWTRALPLAQALSQKAMREGDPTQRSSFYLKRGIVAQHNGDARGAAESVIIALEIKPDNLDALDALGELARERPDAYDFPATYRELEKLYKKRDAAQALQARVLVAQAVMRQREGDLDAAEAQYAAALEMMPSDFTILSALVELHCDMRRWSEAADVLRKYLDTDAAARNGVRVQAMMRLAIIHDEGEMDPHRASSVLRDIIKLDPAHQEAHYRLAQEMYLLGRHGEARAAIERVIELAAAPGTALSPEALARYYYYLGRILEAGGDPRSAASQYRRAAEYDPGYAPPALALAKRAVENGDQRAAESLLINAAHASMEHGGAQAAVPLQRGLARILLAAGDRGAAIEAYRGILAVEPDGAADRVALADIYAMDDLPKAVQELRRVLDRDLRHAPAYRLLASYYSRLGEIDRCIRVLSIMDLLGYAEDSDRGTLQQTRATQVHTPLRASLDDDTRTRFLIPEAGSSALSGMFSEIAAELTALFPQPPLGESLVPGKTVDDPGFKVAITDSERLFGIDPEIYVGEKVPGAVAVLAFPRRIIVIDAGLLAETDSARRFVLGRAFESIRGGYSVLLHLTSRERRELGSLLKSLLLPEAEQMPPTKEFVRTLPKRATRMLERFAGHQLDVSTEAYIDAMIAAANRAGLFACDDFAAAARMLSRLAGESMAVTQDGALALGAITGGPDLVRFFLSDDYRSMRETLARVPQVPPM
jgi:tetratricopeptide (TPR) repeat protein